MITVIEVDLTGIDITGLEDVIPDPTRVPMVLAGTLAGGGVRAKAVSMFAWRYPVEFDFPPGEFERRMR